MPITSFDKQNLKTIRADLDAALKAVETKHGMKLSIGNIRFQANTFRTTLTSLIGETATADASVNSRDERAPKWRREYMINARYLFADTVSLEGRLPKLDTKLTYNEDEYTIVGARPRAAMSIVLKKVRGGNFIALSPKHVMSLIEG